MPVAKLKPMLPPAPDTERGPRLTSQIAGAVAAPSPARQLQRRLAEYAADVAARDSGKWPLRQRIAFIVTSSTALWMAILMTGAATTRLVA